MDKYEFTGETKNFCRTTLHQIRALKTFGDVRVGELGGWIEKENNLSQDNNCWVSGNAWVSGDAKVSGNAWVSGNAKVSGNAWVSDNAWVSGDAKVSGNAWVSDNAWVTKTSDYMIVGPVGSRDQTTTFYKTKNDGICVSCGCFYGTIDEFEKAVEETHGDSKHGIVYRAAIALAKTQLEV